VGHDRFKGVSLDERGVIEKFGVPPQSIPDLLALVGDTADGIPGIPRWGMKSASSLLASYKTLEKIPKNPAQWKVPIRGADALSLSLEASRKEAALFKKLATLRYDVPLREKLKDIAWKGPKADAMAEMAEILEISIELEPS
jgi:5'-3' exonuclease